MSNKIKTQYIPMAVMIIVAVLIVVSIVSYIGKIQNKNKLLNTILTLYEQDKELEKGKLSEYIDEKSLDYMTKGGQKYWIFDVKASKVNKLNKDRVEDKGKYFIDSETLRIIEAPSESTNIRINPKSFESEIQATIDRGDMTIRLEDCYEPTHYDSEEREKLESELNKILYEEFKENTKEKIGAAYGKSKPYLERIGELSKESLEKVKLKTKEFMQNYQNQQKISK